MLTRAVLDPCHQSYFRDAQSRYEMHRTVEKVTGEGKGIWHLNQPILGAMPILLIRSQNAQNWDNLIDVGYVLEAKELYEATTFNVGTAVAFSNRM